MYIVGFVGLVVGLMIAGLCFGCSLSVVAVRRARCIVACCSDLGCFLLCLLLVWWVVMVVWLMTDLVDRFGDYA